MADRFRLEQRWRRNSFHAGRTQLFVEEANGAGWGFYSGKQLYALMLWLEHGNDAEQELADRIHETFEACLQPAVDPEVSLLFPPVLLMVSDEAADTL